MLRNFYSFFTLICLLPTIVFAQNVTLKGRITDKQTGDPLPGSTIKFDDYKNTVLADTNGEYVLTGITPGEYKVKVKSVGFSEYEKKITIGAGQTLTLDIQLQAKNNQLETVNVYGKIDKESEAAGRASEKNANNITNVVTAAVMEKSPDINAANVLSRVSGVTIQRNTGGEEAYAIIRGLEPRYNNTLINGVKVTSPDEKSRYVSLDIVPSDLLQRIEVSKSLLPEMEGDAIGGTVNLIFKDAPDSVLFKANAQIGYSQIFLDRKFISFPKQDIRQQSVYERFGPNYIAQPNDFSRSNLDFQPKTIFVEPVFFISWTIPG